MSLEIPLDENFKLITRPGVESIILVDNRKSRETKSGATAYNDMLYYPTISYAIKGYLRHCTEHTRDASSLQDYASLFEDNYRHLLKVMEKYNDLLNPKE